MQLRLFNQEGVEIAEDDLDYQKSGTVLFASRGTFETTQVRSSMKVFNQLNMKSFKILVKVVLVK